jgi:alkaline phosphatase D
VPLTRRTAIGSGLALTSAVLLADQRPSAATPRLPRSPFTLGVASGDPRPDGFVLWTRLALSPLELDGRGGMPARDYSVRFQVATDRRFTHVVRDRSVAAVPEWGHSARVRVTGLRPGREYFFRWMIDGYRSQVGRAVTAPAAGTMPTRLRIAQVTCSGFAPGYFTAYRDVAAQRPDLVVHLGDFIYEFAPRSTDVRPPLSGKCRTLEDFRLRYAQTLSDVDLHRARAVAPWLVTFDDHDVENDYAGLISEYATLDFPAIRAAAYQAWFENHPVGWGCQPQAGAVAMRRRVRWGELAQLHLLDTRQFRSDQVCGRVGDCPDRLDPSRSILGAAQTGWLAKGLATSPHRWDLLAQQVFFSRRLVESGGTSGYMSDAWDGYAHDQAEVVGMLGPSASGPGPRNPIVLTGDTHAAWLSRVKADWGDPGSATVATEIGCTSITSAGDGYDGDGTHPFMVDNPHLEFYNALRGFSLLTLDPTRLAVDYRVVDRVRVPDAPAWTRARFVVPDREAAPVAVSARRPPADAARVRRAPQNLARATLREELGH